MVKVSKLIDNLILLSIFLFLQYVFWFQYVVTEISSFLTAMGTLMVLCILLKRKINLSALKPGLFVVLFVVSTLISCIALPLNRSVSLGYFPRLIRYMIPFAAICIYVGRSYEKLKKVFCVFCISGALISLSLLLFGEYNNVLGAYGIGNLNQNTFSSYLLAGLLGSVALLNCTYKKSHRMMLFATIAIDAVAQVRAGSRRGILVLIFVLLMYSYAVATVKYRKNWLVKLIMIFGGIVALLILITDFGILVPGYSSFGQLFTRTTGDYNRIIYQKAALDLFLRQPILGYGLGSVGQVAGMYSHSFYFETLASNGLIGMLILMIPLLKQIWASHRMEKSDNLSTEMRMQNATLIIVIVSMLITAIAVVFIYDAIFYLLLALIAAMRSICAFSEKSN